jgi:hypothetical protein
MPRLRCAPLGMTAFLCMKYENEKQYANQFL